MRATACRPSAESNDRVTPAEAEKIAVSVVDAIGAFCLDHFNAIGREDIAKKGPRDFVTHVDLEAEDIGRQLLHDLAPNVPVVGEERGGSIGTAYWILDPLDGTTNFLAGLPYWSVSLGYMEHRYPKAGVISIPAMRMTLSSADERRPTERGMGLGTSNGLVAVGRNPLWAPKDRLAYETAIEEQGQTVVSLGSCAASIALVARGQLAGYVEKRTRLWDCAAGVAICRAAGLATTITAPDPQMCVDVAVGSAALMFKNADVGDCG